MGVFITLNSHSFSNLFTYTGIENSLHFRFIVYKIWTFKFLGGVEIKHLLTVLILSTLQTNTYAYAHSVDPD